MEQIVCLVRYKPFTNFIEDPQYRTTDIREYYDCRKLQKPIPLHYLLQLHTLSSQEGLMVYRLHTSLLQMFVDGDTVTDGKETDDEKKQNCKHCMGFMA